MRRRNRFHQWRLVWFVFVGVAMVLRVIQVVVQISPQALGTDLSMDMAILEEEWLRPLNTTISTSTTELSWLAGESSSKEAHPVNATNHNNSKTTNQNRKMPFSIPKKNKEDNKNDKVSTELSTMQQLQPSTRQKQQEQEQQEQPLTLPQQEQHEIVDYDNSFSACLMIMDENHRLPEWLAYHYYMMPLRHVVLLVDPRSETSPMDTVQRWRPYIKIDVWNFTDLHQYKPQSKKHANLDSWERHRRVQKFFYTQCGHYFRTHNRTWTTFHDVDEYIYLNPLSVLHATQRLTVPGNIRRYLEERSHGTISSPTTETTTSDGATTRKRGRHQQGTTRTTSMHRTKGKLYQAMHKDHCILMERNYFGSVPESMDRIQQGVPSFLNASHFETLSWLHRTSHTDMVLNGMGKSIVDVSGPPSLTFTGNVHRIIPSCSAQTFPVGMGPLRIRHYLGSWQAYASRNDARVGVKRNRERYLFVATVGEHDLPDDSVRPWLEGFCRQFHWNITLIQSLLQGSGQVPPISQQVRQAQWSMTPQQIATVIQEGKNQASQQPQNRQQDTRFAKWLERRFVVHTLPNGTVQVQVRNPPPHHHHHAAAVNESMASTSSRPDVVYDLEPYPYSFE